MSGSNLLGFALETGGAAAAGTILVGLFFWIWFCVFRPEAMLDETTEDGLRLTSRELEAAELARMEADGVELWRPDPERLRQFDDEPSSRTKLT